MRSGAHSSNSRSVVARNRACARSANVSVTRYSTATEASITTGPVKLPSRVLPGVAVTSDQRCGARDSATRYRAAGLDIVQECRQSCSVRLEPALQQADRLGPYGRFVLRSPPPQRLVRIVRDVSHVQCRHGATLAQALAG